MVAFYMIPTSYIFLCQWKSGLEVRAAGRIGNFKPNLNEKCLGSKRKFASLHG